MWLVIVVFVFNLLILFVVCFASLFAFSWLVWNKLVSLFGILVVTLFGSTGWGG